jgi:hypothetical protein
MSRPAKTAATGGSPVTAAVTGTARSARARQRAWLAEREADLLPAGYFHVVFTLPAEVADIAYQNKAVVYDLLFKVASKTMLTIAAVLHIWGSAMTHHPHVHMIVPGGSIAHHRQ